VLRIHRAVELGDVAALLAEVHSTGECRAAVQQAMEGEAGVFRGHDGLRRWLAELHDVYEGIESKVVEVEDLGDRVLVSFVVRGTARRSGITLDQPLVQVVTLRDGQAVAVQDHRSREAALEALR
jgi:ketosteroid isomerase-like protein